MSQERFKLERVVMEDVDEIAAMVQESSQSPRIILEFQDCDRAEFLAWNKAGAVSELNGCHVSEGRAEMWKMVDYVEPEKPKIVGVAVWGWDEEAVDKLFTEKAALPLPKGTKLDLREKFITEITVMEAKHRPKGKYFELLELATAPSHRGLGLSTPLINVGLKRGDVEGVPCYLSGSPMGVPVYKKRGFEEVGRLTIGLEEFGGEEGATHVHVAMIRMPST